MKAFTCILVILLNVIPVWAQNQASETDSSPSQTNPGTVNERDYVGQTLLALAVLNGEESRVAELLEQRADPNIPDHIGMTPLAYLVMAPYFQFEEGEVEDSDQSQLMDALLSSDNLLGQFMLMVEVRKTMEAPGMNFQQEIPQETRELFFRIAELLLKAGADSSQVNVVGMSPLHLTILSEEAALCKLFLEHGAQVNLQTINGRTALFEATNKGSIELCALLLESGADPQIADHSSWTPLHVAAANGPTALVETLIQHGAVLSARDSAGYTPLHTAAEKGHADIVSLLMKHGAQQDILSSSYSDYTPVISASLNGHSDVLKILIRAGGKVNLDVPGEVSPPLSQAAHHAHPEAVRLLLESGARVNDQDARGHSALHLAVMDPKWMEKEIEKYGFGGTGYPAPVKGSETDRLEVVRLLLEAGADVHALNNFGNTPLHMLSINWDSPEAARLLVQHGARVDPKGYGNSTPLLNTSEKGFVNLAAYLLEQGVDISAQVPVTGATTLHWAILKGHRDLVEVLLENDAPLRVPDNARQTPAVLCVYQGQVEMLKLLAAKDPGVLAFVSPTKESLLHLAAGMGHAEMCRFLLDAGLDPQAMNVENETPLFALARGPLMQDAMEKAFNEQQVAQNPAVGYGGTEGAYHFADDFTEITRLLVKAGANLSHRDKRGNSALILACNSDLTEVVEIMLAQGVDPEIPHTQYGFLPIHAAADYGNTEIVKLFLDRGVDANARATLGAPLHYASVSVLTLPRKNLEIVDYLVERGADVNLFVSPEWRTPLFCAFEKRNYFVAERLIFHGADFSGRDLVSGESLYQQVRKSENKPLLTLMSARRNFSEVQGFQMAIGDENDRVAEVEGEIIRTSDVIAYGGGTEAFFQPYSIRELEDPDGISRIMQEVKEKLETLAIELISLRLMDWACQVADLEIKELRIINAKTELATRVGVRSSMLQEDLRPLDWTLEDFERVAHWMAAAGLLTETVIYPTEAITPEAIRTYYEETKLEHASPGRIRLQMMTLKNRNAVSEIQDALMAGEDFTELTRTYSTDSRSQQGGDLGWIRLSQMRSDFVDSFSEIEIGSLSKPLPMGAQFALLRISDLQEPVPEPLENRADAIREELAELAAKPTRDQLLGLLLNVARVHSTVELPWTK